MQSDAFDDNLIELASKYDMFTEKEAIEFGLHIHLELEGEREAYNPKYTLKVFDDMVRKGEGLAKSLVGKTYNWI